MRLRRGRFFVSPINSVVLNLMSKNSTSRWGLFGNDHLIDVNKMVWGIYCYMNFFFLMGFKNCFFRAKKMAGQSARRIRLNLGLSTSSMPAIYALYHKSQINFRFSFHPFLSERNCFYCPSKFEGLSAC